MKHSRILCALTACAMMASAAVIPAAAGSGYYLIGDADRSGSVTVEDVTAIQKRLANLSIDPFNRNAADVNGDGMNIGDATLIQMYLAEYSNPCHIGEQTTDYIQPTTEDYELPYSPE